MFIPLPYLSREKLFVINQHLNMRTKCANKLVPVISNLSEPVCLVTAISE